MIQHWFAESFSWRRGIVAITRTIGRKNSEEKKLVSNILNYVLFLVIERHNAPLLIHCIFYFVLHQRARSLVQHARDQAPEERDKKTKVNNL